MCALVRFVLVMACTVLFRDQSRFCILSKYKFDQLQQTARPGRRGGGSVMMIATGGPGRTADPEEHRTGFGSTDLHSFKNCNGDVLGRLSSGWGGPQSDRRSRRDTQNGLESR